MSLAPVVEELPVTRITQAIQQRVGAQRYQVWFSNSTKFDVKHDALEVAVANDFISEWISRHYARSIQEAASEVMGNALPVRINVVPQLFDGKHKTSEAREPGTSALIQRHQYVPKEAEVVSKPIDFTKKSVDTKAHPKLGVGMREESRIAAPVAPIASQPPRLRHDLSDYIVGPSNQLAYSAVQYVAQYPGAQYNPLFIHGSCGLGKTHLLQGLCKEFIKHHPTKKWMYCTGEEFTNEFLVALRNNRVDAFRRKMRELELLVIDDVHFLAGKKATQEEFLHTFNAIEAMGRQVVLASDEHPKLIAEFGESLVNRFVSGMVVRIDPPNQQMRCDLLRRMSLKNRTNLTEEVISWVARRVTQNVRELEGAVTRISAHTRLTGRPADLMLAQEALGDLDRQLVAPVKPESVLSAVCSYFGLEMKELMSGRRQRTISLARSVAMYLVRRTSKLSFPEIAGKMGKRNHSTVISACRRVERAAQKNERFAWSTHLGDRDEEAGELLQRLEEQCRAMS